MISSETIRELLCQLIRCPSVTPDDAGCQDIIAERLLRAGFEVERLNWNGTSNLWAVHGDSGPHLCFAGHSDVVPSGPLEAWSSPPFEPEFRGEYLYGRGAADMKSGLAAMVIAAERIAAEQKPGIVSLLITSDEEGSGEFGTARVLDEICRRETKIDAALVAEPTSQDVLGDTVKVGRRGSLHGAITVKGVQGHTAYPELAENAAHILARAVSKVASLRWAPLDDTFPATTLQFSSIEAGTGATNVIPGLGRARFNVRYGTAHSVMSIQNDVAHALAEDGIPAEVEWHVSAEPFLTQSRELVRPIIEAVRQITGREPRATADGGTSDARCFAKHGIPVVEFGPSNKTIHAVDERVAVSDLNLLTDIYLHFAKMYFHWPEF